MNERPHVRTSFQHDGGRVDFEPREISVATAAGEELPDDFAEGETISGLCDRAKQVGQPACRVACSGDGNSGVTFTCPGRDGGQPCALSADKVRGTAQALVWGSGIIKK